MRTVNWPNGTVKSRSASEARGEIALPGATIRPLLSSDEHEFTTLAVRSLDFHRRWIVAPKSPAEFQRYFARMDSPDAAGFVICDGEDDSIVGFINLNPIIGEPYCRGLLGYGMFYPYARQGYMTTGLSAVIEHAFDELSLHRLEADIQPSNQASVRLIERLGFTMECVSEGFIRINGEWADHERWVLINRS
jgi:ribosomal-protein-alanine N-acetyltransferase